MMVHRREPPQRTPKEIEEVKGPQDTVNILDAVRTHDELLARGSIRLIIPTTKEYFSDILCAIKSPRSNENLFT